MFEYITDTDSNYSNTKIKEMFYNGLDFILTK